MDRVLIAAAVVAVAIVAAIVAERRRPSAPTQPRWQVPTQLDRTDFARPDAPWLVVVFTSATCDACAAVREKAVVLESASVAVQEVEHGAARTLHERYHVEAVPMTLVAGADGVVTAAFVGTPSATDLWAAVAESREPGSTPEPGLGTPRRDGDGG